MSASVLAIVPALNEEATVAAVVQAIRSDLGADVLVVDDGSTDATAAKAIAAGAFVARHPFNLGVGAALRTGFRYADAERLPASPSRSTPTASTSPPRPSTLLELVGSGAADVAVGPGSPTARGSTASGPCAGSACGCCRASSPGASAPASPTRRAASGPSAGSPSSATPRPTRPPTSPTPSRRCCSPRTGGSPWSRCPCAMRERMGGQASNNAFKSIYHLCRLTLVIALHPLRRPLAGGSADEARDRAPHRRGASSSPSSSRSSAGAGCPRTTPCSGSAWPWWARCSPSPGPSSTASRSEVGIVYGTSLVFALAILFLLIVCINLSMHVSRLEQRVEALAQELALRDVQRRRVRSRRGRRRPGATAAVPHRPGGHGRGPRPPAVSRGRARSGPDGLEPRRWR